MVLDDRTVIVTGGAKGMGEKIAEACAAAGADVLIVDIDPAVTETGQRLGLQSFVGDVTNEETVAEVVEAATGRAPIRGLANVAGLHTLGKAAEVADSDWERTLAVNLTAPMLWTRAVVPHMVAAGGGSIVNVASINAARSRPASAAYTSAKAGLVGYTRSTAHDYGRQGIRANSISPGPIDTAIFRAAVDSGRATVEAHTRVSALGRLGEPSEVAAAAVFLLSEASSYITAHDLVVDGGRSVAI